MATAEVKEEENVEKESKNDFSTGWVFYYWPQLGARGTPVRLALALNGCQWKEANLDKENFKKELSEIKGANIEGFPNFAMPIIKHGNFILSQTPAITYFICDCFNLNPKNPIDNAKHWQIILTIGLYPFSFFLFSFCFVCPFVL